MDEGADTGDVVSQAEVPLPEGVSGAEAERLTTEAGARLLLAALALPEPPRRSQPVAGASYQPWPRSADLRIGLDWTARRAFGFVRGAAQWGPFEMHVQGEILRVRDALGFRPGRALGAPYERAAGVLSVAFSNGVVDFSSA